MRHLHARFPCGGKGIARSASASVRGTGPPLAGGQSVPLHWLRQDHPRSPGSCRDNLMIRLPLAVIVLLPVTSSLLADKEPVFLHLPLDLDRVKAITPLGNLNPRGGHVFPTDHIYLDYNKVKDLPVVAPAAGTVIAIREQFGGDSKVEVQVNQDLAFYVAPLHVAEDIKQGGKVKAGQVLGRTSGSGML